MKKTYPILLLLIIISYLSACHQKGDATTSLSPSLIQAETVMYEFPDSALHILQNMQALPASSKLQNATWTLLMTQAKYKNDIKQSDSLINIAYDYFIKKDNAQRRAMVLYYKGVLYGEEYDSEKALKYFLEADEEIQKTEDYQLAYRINTDVGYIYAYRNLHNYALEYFKKAQHYALLSNFQEYIADSYINFGRVYSIKEENDKSIEFYKKAIEISEEYNLPRPLAYAMNEINIMLIRKKNYEKALHYAQKSVILNKTDQNILGLGYTYRLLHQYDSAHYYLNEASKSSNIYTARSAFQALYYLSNEKKDYKKAVKYSEKLWLYQDSITKIERNKALIEMQEKYNQQKIINEKNKLKIEKEETMRNALIVFIVLLCIIAATIYYYQQKIIRQKKELSEKEKEIRFATVKIHMNEETINRNETRMKELVLQMEDNKEVLTSWKEQQTTLQELQQQNETLKLENLELKENIDNYTSSLHEKLKELDMLSHLSEENQFLRRREDFLCNQLIKKTELFYKIRSLNYIDDALWEKIKENINLIFNDYTNRLYQQIPTLTESDIQICCLIKLRFSNNDIANVLNISPTSVSKRKLRLKERILQKIGSLSEHQTLDLWLMEY